MWFVHIHPSSPSLLLQLCIILLKISSTGLTVYEDHERSVRSFLPFLILADFLLVFFVRS